jgi:hypothetical protein
MMMIKKLPHATAIFECVRPTIRGPTEVGMNLMPLLAALIQKRQLKKRPHVGPFARQSDEQRNVGRIVLQALSVRVEIDRPRVTSDVKSIGRHVLSDPHPFRERVPGDLELVGTVHRLRHRRRRRGRRSRTRRRRRRTRIRQRGLAARKHRPRIRAFSQNPPHHDDHDLYK